MKNRIFEIAATAVAAICVSALRTDACTNIIVTRGASADGSNMISYAADSHNMFGELYFHPAADWKAGSPLEVREWDTARPLGSIAQVAHTWKTVGNMNEKQLIIAETTYGGREELYDENGGIDYGTLIYVTLQRASSAREAIKTIAALADEYGYCSEGESFSIADKNEAWVMDLIGRGKGRKGIVYVARRIPDGYICSHANQARIRRFPQNDPENCLFAPDVISLAREKGWFSGEDKDFSFVDAYNPVDFGGARACDARAWSAFNILCDGVFTYMDEDGREVSEPAGKWLQYVMGNDLSVKGFPLFVKPSRKINVKDMANAMRDHYEGTPMDMTTDIGAGGNALPYRWRPMQFSVDGKTYVNERAIATQQTGFWFVAQSRPALPDMVGALVWFGTDDAATSYLTPIYVATKKVPECFRVGNGDLLHYSATASFWMNNRISNACYKMYNQMAPYVRERIDEFENNQMGSAVAKADAEALRLYGNGGKFARKHTAKFLTEYSVNTAQEQFAAWSKLEETLLVKFMDGNVKVLDADGNLTIEHPDYTQKWKESVAKDHGSVLEVRN